MILTEEQKQKYVDAQCQICPVCDSHNISGHALEIEGSEVWQPVSCDDCHAEWQDVYRFAFVETQEELDG